MLSENWSLFQSDSLRRASLIIKGGIKMGAGKLIGAGLITWLLGGGVLLFIVVFLLLKAC